MTKFFALAAVAAAAVVSLAAPVAADWASAGSPVPFVAAPPPRPPAPGRPTEITIFERADFQGRSMTFNHSVPSLAALEFNDRVGSVRIKGPRDWVLCEHRNFMGKCGRVHGKANNLKRIKLEGQVSSLYPVPDPPKK